MTAPIATATRCSCSAHVVVQRNAYDWQAYCLDCYAPVEGCGDRAQCIGYGKTPEEALWAWQDQHDAAHEVEWMPESDVIGNLARDVGFEAERQRGWGLMPGQREQQDIFYFEPGGALAAGEASCGR